MTVKYNHYDILDFIECMHFNDYPAQTGVLRATLTSVLISVKVRNPELFEHIVKNQMETLKELAKEPLD